MIEAFITTTDGQIDKVKCKEIQVDKDGILLAVGENGSFVAMYKSWDSWIIKGHGVHRVDELFEEEDIDDSPIEPYDERKKKKK